MVRGKLFWLAVPILILLIAAPGFSQTEAGTITGRALDNSGALVPGVEVSISSPSMIGNGRSAPTDETGAYRFTLLKPGTYRVTFALPGFKTLNIDGVTVSAGTTATTNGIMEVASVAEEVTVSSTAPTIDLEAATVGVNWGTRNMEELPWGRSVVALAQMVPGMFVTTYDVGGNQMGGSSNLSGRVYGRSGGEVRTYDGLQWCMSFDDYSTYDEIQLSSAAKGAEAQSPGVTANFVLKSGGNQFHGGAYAAWEDGSFQSHNVDAALIAKGFPAQSPNNFTRYDDLSFDVGGPLIHNKLWFYAAYADSFTGQHIAGFVDAAGAPALYTVRLSNPTLKLTYQLNSAMKLETFGQFPLKQAPFRTGSQFVTKEATQDQWSFSDVGPALKWTYIMSSKMTSELGISRGGYWWPTNPHTTDVRKTDSTTTSIRGAYLKNYSEPIRFQWNGSWSYFTDIGGKSNEIKTGFLGWWDKRITRNDGYPNQELYQYKSLAGETNFFLHPNSVQLFDYPNLNASVVKYESAFVNDKVKLSRKLTMNVGLRYDHYSSYLPEQGNLGLGPWAVKKIYPERHDSPIYHAFAPRISIAYDVFGDGKVAFKASYGRYAGAGSAPGASPGPSLSNINPAATTTCTYNNWTGQIPFVPGAGADGILLTKDDTGATFNGCTGGGGIQRLDTNLKSPYLDEYTTGLEIGLSKNYLLSFNGVRKFDKGGSKTLDLAQPFSAYTDVVCGVLGSANTNGIDPGPDNKVGTADDKVMCAYSVPSTYPTFGQVNQLTTQYVKGEGTKNYSAFEGTFQKQYSNKWSALFGYVVDFNHINNAIPLNPNTFLYNYQIPEWNQSVKANGTYELPWFGMKYGTTYQIQNGPWYSRSAQMKNAANSTVTIKVDGHFGRYPLVKLWDNRIAKTFKIGDKQTIEAMFDLYNTLNANTLLSQVTTNGPTFLQPTTPASGATSATPILPARIFKLGVRWKF